MYGALDGLGFNADSLRRNHFCIGVKRGNEYQCGGDANENAINNTVDLLIETVNRIQRWRVWGSWWVEEVMDEWLEKRDRLEQRLRGKYGDEIIKATLRLINEFINYNERFMNYWHEVSSEVKELIEDLMSGNTKVIIWGNEEGVSVYGEYITLNAHKTNTGSITVHLELNGLKGITIKVPDVFRRTMSREEYGKFINEVLMALRGGLEETDGFIDRGKAAMGTTQVWQAIVWSLLYPGEVHVHADAINVNEGGMTIRWGLRANRYKPIKGKILSNAEELSKEELLAFTFTAVLGDGDAGVWKVANNGRVYDEAVITITMSSERLDTWKPLLERLRELGFNCGNPIPISDGVVNVRFYGSNAISLARAMINVLPPILRDVLDALSFEKWLRINQVANMELKWRRGESQVIVAGYGFTVHVQKGTVRLMHRARDEIETEMVIEALRVAYGDGFTVNVNKSSRRRGVVIPMYVFEKYEDIKEQVIEVLCRKLKKTKDERKKQIIAKHLRRLALTEEATTAC